MKLYTKISLLALSLLSLTTSVNARTDSGLKSKYEHQIIVGYNFGATAPMPIPREVRSITAYWPQFTPQLGYQFTYNYTDKWAIKTGLVLDLKGMGVQDKVKYMYTDIIMNGAAMKGYFTGKNETRVKSSYLTVPVKVAYTLNDKWKLTAGGYISYKTSSEFSGTVWDGYIREIVGDESIVESNKIDIVGKDIAVFDFGKEMRKYDVGIMVGFEHQFNHKFGMYTDLTYGLTPVFPSNFTGIDMKMRNIYVAVGMSYRLK